MKYFRRTWFRLLAVSAALLGAALVFLDEGTTAQAREAATRSLQGATLLFAICAALSIAMFTNYVRGLRDAYERKVSDVRDLLERFFDEHKESQDPDVRLIIDTYITPLLELNMGAWHSFEPVKEILPRVDEPARRLHRRDRTFLPRYLLRIEDTTNELGILLIRRIVSQLHIDNVSGTFLLVAFGISVLAISSFVPNNPVGNFVAVWLSLSVVVLAVVELLLILSYVRQEGREEQPEIEANDEEPNRTPHTNAGEQSGGNHPPAARG